MLPLSLTAEKKSFLLSVKCLEAAFDRAWESRPVGRTNSVVYLWLHPKSYYGDPSGLVPSDSLTRA